MMRMQSGVDAAELYESSKEKKDVWTEVQEAIKHPQAGPDMIQRASFCTQLKVLTERHVRSAWRDPGFVVARFLWTALAAVLVGTVFYNLGGNCSINGMVFRIAAL